jgi:hypothetical protein
MAQNDYKKAFDSLPHTWIVTVKEMYQICPTRRQFVEALMKEWKYHTVGHVKRETVAIKQEICQSDSFSPLLFCLALILLTNKLNKQGAGYEVKGKKIKSAIYSIWMT